MAYRTVDHRTPGERERDERAAEEALRRLEAEERARRLAAIVSVPVVLALRAVRIAVAVAIASAVWHALSRLLG